MPRENEADFVKVARSSFRVATFTRLQVQSVLSLSKVNIDHRVRLAAFEWLEKQTQIHGDVLPRDLLARGFEFEGTRVPLVSPQGIFKPQILPEIPLSITTTPESPYKDSVERDNLFLYSYWGNDPQHRDNVGLRGTPCCPPLQGGRILLIFRERRNQFLR